MYEWDQTLVEVNLYVPVPPGVRAKQLFCDVERTHLRFGLAPNPPFLDVRAICGLRGGLARACACRGARPC